MNKKHKFSEAENRSGAAYYLFVVWKNHPTRHSRTKKYYGFTGASDLGKAGLIALFESKKNEIEYAYLFEKDGNKRTVLKGQPKRSAIQKMKTPLRSDSEKKRKRIKVALKTLQPVYSSS